MGRLEIRDVHLSVSSEGAYGSVSTLNFNLVNRGLLPSLATVHVKFYDREGKEYGKTLRLALAGFEGRNLTVDEYIEAVKARIVAKRLLALRPDAAVEVYPT